MILLRKVQVLPCCSKAFIIFFTYTRLSFLQFWSNLPGKQLRGVLPSNSVTPTRYIKCAWTLRWYNTRRTRYARICLLRSKDPRFIFEPLFAFQNIETKQFNVLIYWHSFRRINFGCNLTFPNKHREDRKINIVHESIHSKNGKILKCKQILLETNITVIWVRIRTMYFLRIV